MNDTVDLPQGYTPYDALHLCSNTLERVQVPLLIGGTPILLIGQGHVPQVWLSAPADLSGASWHYVVRQSKAANPGVRVDSEKSKRRLTIRIAGQQVLVLRWDGIATATVLKLDLRPIGLTVTGDENGLLIGGAQMIGNTIRNSRVAFSFG